MKIIFLFLLGICTMVTTKARLIEKITDRTLPTETITGSSPPVRLARQTYGDYMVGVRDDLEDSNEFFTSFNRKVRHFNTGPNIETSRRIPRESTERTDKPAKNATKPITTTPSTRRSKSKVVLVKKPIPKYNEMDYDDDFQMKMNKSPVKFIDSGEHEDEDFNVDDYDFDVNHDEFSGRGKPLEPRMKHKGVENAPKPEPKRKLHPVPPEIKIKSKVNIPQQVVSSKKERSAEKQTSKKANEKDDYYDETSSTTKEPQKPRDLDDEFNEENEESKEFYGKLSNVRLVRSPWKTNPDKFGDKGIAGVSKILTILPMFPQVPEEDQDRVGFAPNHL